MKLYKSRKKADSRTGEDEHRNSMVWSTELGILISSLAMLFSCASKSVTMGAGQISGHSDEVDVVVDAVRRADTVFLDSRFWDMVKQRKWIAAPDSGCITDGAEVADTLSSLLPSAQLYHVTHLGRGWLPFIAGGTTASTTACIEESTSSSGRCGKITINEDRVDQPQFMVNTIAHEVTHVIGTYGKDAGTCRCKKGGNDSPRYIDTPDHPTSAEVWLVSYALGDLAQCFHMHKGDAKATEQCFEGMVNGAACDRIHIQCCAESEIHGAVLEELRASTGKCTFQCRDKKACTQE